MASRPEQLFKSDRLSPRAQAIARGLLISGRILPPGRGRASIDRGMLRLDGDGARNIYWLACDGSSLSRGEVGDIDELQPGFVDMLARIGGEKMAA